MSKDALIIGSGIAGISAGIRLAVKGYKVTIFESADRPGGKLDEIRLGNYRFDAGPSLFTLPHLVDDLFRLAGKEPENHFRYRQLPITCRYFWEDGLVIDAWSDGEKFALEVNEKTGLDPDVIRKYLRHCIRLFELTGSIFLENSLHRPLSYLDSRFFKALANVYSYDMLKTMDSANRKRLKHPKLVQLFNRMATYNGSSPYQASGVLNVIAGLEHGSGAFVPEGGMYSITKSLTKLAKDSGVQFEFNRRVDEIVTEKGKAAGIRTGGDFVPAGLVVSNMDVMPTYTKLLKGRHMPRTLLRQERSSSALIFYWGMNKKLPQLDSHNIFFSEDYPAEFSYIFRKLDVSDDPTVYIHVSARHNPADAPLAGDNWFVMLNVPHNAGQDWDGITRRLRQAVISKLSRMLGEDIESLIVEEEVLDPVGIESKTSSYLGALYGSSSNHWHSAFLRHPNFSHRFRNLYFCGGSVHPGGGIPLCILSSKIMAKMIKPAI